VPRTTLATMLIPTKLRLLSAAPVAVGDNVVLVAVAVVAVGTVVEGDVAVAVVTGDEGAGVGERSEERREVMATDSEDM